MAAAKPKTNEATVPTSPRVVATKDLGIPQFPGSPRAVVAAWDRVASEAWEQGYTLGMVFTRSVLGQTYEFVVLNPRQ